jgi:hypothetical protein
LASSSNLIALHRRGLSSTFSFSLESKLRENNRSIADHPLSVVSAPEELLSGQLRCRRSLPLVRAERPPFWTPFSAAKSRSRFRTLSSIWSRACRGPKSARSPALCSPVSAARRGGLATTATS